MDTGVILVFGMCSCYKEDYTSVGGYNLSIHGWGGEDVDIFDKFIAAGKNITVFRTVDPGMVHVYHKRYCDPSLPNVQMVMCQGTRGNAYVSLNNAANMIYTDRERFLQFARKMNNLPDPNHHK